MSHSTREARWEGIRRRLISLPALFAVFLALLPAAPALLLVAGVLDLIGRRRLATSRTVLFLGLYLACEVVGVLAAALIQAASVLERDAERKRARYYRLQWWWAHTLLSGATSLYGMQLHVDGADVLDMQRSWIVLMRHSSIADTLLPSVLLSRPHGLRLRYVLKRELLWDPCLDLVGNQLPNAFVRRDSGDSAQEIERVRRLAQGLGPGDGVLIYPEGSRFSESRRDRVRTRLRAEGSSRLVLANALENLLPPRRGGVLALLDGAPDAQVLVCTHHGFEGTMSLADLTSGRLIGRRIDVEFRTIPRGEIPLDRDARAQWLDERWLRVDAWLQQRVHGELP